MIITLPKLGPVQFRDDLTPEQLNAQLDQLAKKYQFELPVQELTYGEMASRAFERGTKQLGSVFGDIIPAMAAKGLGFDEYAQRQMEEARQTQEELATYAAPQYPTLESVKGPADVPGFALETFVEQIPNILTSLIPGVGAEVIAARTALGGVAKQLTAQAAQRGLAGEAAAQFINQGLKQAAPEVAKRAGVAQGAGVFLGSYAQNAPEIFQNIYESTGTMDVGTSLLFGSASAALDSVLPASLARTLTGPARVGVVEKLLEKSGMERPLIRSMTAGILKGLGAEGLTEGAQEAISISAEKFVADNPQVFESKEWNRIMEASVRGAVAGGGFGAVGGTVEGLKVKAEEKRKQAEKALQERKVEEAKKLALEAKELEDMANRQAQMELPGIDREGLATGLTQDPQFVAAKAAVDAKKALAGLKEEPGPKVKPPTGKQIEMFTPEGALTKESEKAAAADVKRAAAQQKVDAKKQADELKQAQRRLSELLSAKQATLPGFSPEEIKAAEEQRAALQAQAAETGQGDLFAGMPAAPAPKPPETLIGNDKDALRAFGKQFGIGPTASILKLDGPLAGKDIANPADAAEVKRILEAYASGKPAAGAAEKIAEYLKRPEFAALEGAVSEQPTTETIIAGGEPGVSVPSGAEADVGVAGAPTETQAAGVEPTGKPAGGAGVGAEPGVTTVKRGRPKLELTPEEQAAKLAERRAAQGAGRDAVRAAQRALNTIQTPFDEGAFATEEDLKAGAEQRNVDVIEALVNAYRIINDPAQRKNKAGEVAREAVNNPNITERQRQIAQNILKEEGKPSKALPVKTTTTAYDDTYNDFNNATEAAEYVSRNGTAFEKFLAARLLPALKGVRLQVVSDPSEIVNDQAREEFINYSPLGMYYKNVIYLNAARDNNGLNNETFLHEAVHAVTVAKINYAFKSPGKQDKNITEFMYRAAMIKGRAYEYYKEMMKRAVNDIDYELRHANVIFTMRRLADRKGPNVFGNTKEFFSYGLTNPQMQEFLMMVPGVYEAKGPEASLFTKFVNAIRNLLGLGPEHKSAFQDLVIVTDQVIKPVQVSEDGTSPSMSVSLARNTLSEIGKIGMNMPKFTADAQENAKNMWSNAPTGLRKIMYGLLRLDNINTMYGKELPSIQKLLDALEKRNGMQEARIKKINDNYEKFQAVYKAEPAAVERMNDMAYDARLAQVDVLDPNFKPTPAQLSEYNRLKNIYNNLPENVQSVYQTIRKDYDDAINEYEKILFGDERTGEAGVLEPSVAKKLRIQYEARKRQVAYIPFLRRGDFWVEYTGDDGERYAHAFQSMRERDLFIKGELQGREHKTYQNLEDASFSRSQFLPTSFVGQLINNLSKQGATEGQINSIYQSYLALFPAESLAKRFMKADNIRGMERDVIRGYGDTMVKWARRLASSKYIPEVDKAIDEVTEQAKAIGTPAMYDVANNIRAQRDFFHNPTYGNLVSKLTTFSYFEYIAGNISSAIVNLSTLPLFSWPVLGGKFGFDQASSALLRGSRIAMNGMEKDPRYRNLYNELMNHAQLEHTVAREVLEGRRQRTEDYTGIWARIMDGISIPFAAAEKLNRGATAIAAYDLAKNSGMSEKDAIRYAITTVKDINTSGLSATAPRWMQTPLGRIFFTFKSFTFNSAFIIARAFHQAFKGESPEIRNMARRQLLGIYGMSMAFSGVKGLPFMGAVTTLGEMIAALFGDDDEPFDIQSEMRQFLGELPYKGAVNYFLNLEVANRTGIAQDIIFRDDPRGVAENGMVLTAMKQAFGPAGSYLFGAERGLKDMAEGQTIRGVEALLPSFVRNGFKAARFMREGALTSKGDPIDTDINAWNLAMQSIGFAPADLSSTYERISAAKGYEREILANRTKILNLYTMARKTGDSDLREEAEERRAKFNAANPNFRITPTTLQRSAAASKAAEKDIIRGIRFNAKLRPEIEAKFFEDEED